MRHALIVMMAFIASIIVSGAPSHAVPRLALEATDWKVGGQMIEKVVDGQHHYYRRHGRDYWRRYYRPVVPPTPVRPLSCGEFRFWNGERCVDVRQSVAQTGTVRGRATTR
jgi:hypothetical protein